MESGALDIFELSTLMGHSSVAITDTSYTHLRKTDHSDQRGVLGVLVRLGRNANRATDRSDRLAERIEGVLSQSSCQSLIALLHVIRADVMTWVEGCSRSHRSAPSQPPSDSTLWKPERGT